MTIDIVNLAVGVAGIVVGLAGIYFTVLSSPAALNAVGTAVSGSGLPSQFNGLSGALTLFSAILIMGVSFVLLFIGLIAVFIPLLKLFGIPEPILAGLWLVTWLYVISAVVTIWLFNDEVAAVVGVFLVFGTLAMMAGTYHYVVAVPKASVLNSSPQQRLVFHQVVTLVNGDKLGVRLRKA